MKGLNRFCVLCIAAVALLPVFANAEQPTRESYSAELRKQLGIDELLAESQRYAEEATRSQLDQMRDQLKDIFARIPADKRQNFNAALDEFAATLATSFDVADAAAAWERFFAASLTDQDLKELVIELRTDKARNRFKAVNDAATKWQRYMEEKQAEAMAQATAKFTARLRELVAQSGTGGTDSHTN